MTRIRPLLLAALGLAGPAAAQEISLRLPVACEIGRSCTVQNYVDRDPGPGVRDFTCGSRTYQGHDGTDFRVPTLRAQREGVAVLAAAEGRVLRGRDGVPDRSVREAGREEVQGRECGNGVVIAHEGGWETQYCHLAQGSISVKPGERVAAGQPIGRVGLSGLTEYPHLHFTLRRNGEVVDPFAAGAAPEACNGGRSLWADSAGLSYRVSEVLNRGFATGPVAMATVEEGAIPAPGPDAPAIVAWVRAIGLRRDDEQRLRVLGPQGEELAVNVIKPLESDKAQYLLFAGKRRPAGGWPAGTYRAVYTVIRAGKPALEESFALDLGS